MANLSVDIGHKLAFNMGWNYYQYGEGSFVGPTAPRYFHANSTDRRSFTHWAFSFSKEVQGSQETNVKHDSELLDLTN